MDAIEHTRWCHEEPAHYDKHMPEAHVWLIVAGVEEAALYRSYNCCTIARTLDAPGEGSISRGQTMMSTCLELMVWLELENSKLIYRGQTCCTIGRALGRTWEWLYEQAAHYDEHMPEAHVWLPVTLQHIHTDLTGLGDVGMEDLGQEVACRRQSCELTTFQHTRTDRVRLEEIGTENLTSEGAYRLYHCIVGTS